MAKLKESIKRVANAISGSVKGRPTPNTPKAGYTGDGRRYKCGGKLRKKK